jgi:alkanesulfonate monooxygenase SsuD/methylene tetrahydromethanopterin reductase-like flavin-dependent oxidoreductase (luciferase family)
MLLSSKANFTIGPKPIQKPHIPIYLAGFVSNTFMRIAKYADGWLPSMSGPLDFIENSVKSLKGQAIKENRSPEHIKTVIMTFPQISQREVMVVAGLDNSNNNLKGFL